MEAPPSRPIETLRPLAAAATSTSTAVSVAIHAGWWDRYRSSISGLPPDTQSVLEADARYIADAAFPMAGAGVDANGFGVHRIRTGIVVGSVQSGKTASMLAVAALLLDRGVDIIVVLAGTRVALWLQTYERLLNQLDGSDVHSAWQRNGKRALVPQPEDVLSGAERVDPYRYLRGARRKAVDALRHGRPLLFVIPKEDDHLLALSRFLAEHTSAEVCTYRARPLSIAVLDDEADDASILDAREGSKITPQYIQNLWSSDKEAPSTRHSALFSTYIAYTATPQANYLQRSHNPLAPRDFHAGLRVPSDRGELSPRMVTYVERAGLKRYYTGGEIFYERLRGLAGDFCVPTSFPAPRPAEEEAAHLVRYAEVRWQMIGNALRCYFVSGAIRQFLQGKRLSRVPQAPVTLEELNDVLPSTHTMLYHPSALKEQHFTGAEDIVRWAMADPGHESSAKVPRGDDGEPILQLDANRLASRLDQEEQAWQAWLSSFVATSSALASLPGGSTVDMGHVAWPAIRQILVDDVFPFVRLRVLNSDPRADERPGFQPTPTDSSRSLWQSPQDIYTVFVAGNVLSRGLTVEGLCTSLFMRSAHEPAADTQMQMQRWFGYRGPLLPFCRVFLFSDQLELFRRYHQNDVALKTEVLNNMDSHTTPFADGVLVLQGEAFKATGKVDSQRVPLHPGATPSIRLIEPPSGPLYLDNIKLAQELLDDGDWKPLAYPQGVTRGLIRATPVRLLEVAAILERLRYSGHDPDCGLEVCQRWFSLQRLLGLEQPLFRPPGLRPGRMSVDPAGCPYSIAAYLRLWALALTRSDMPGMQPTDNPSMPWHMLNLSTYRASEPRFYIGVRFGSEGKDQLAGKTKSLLFHGAPFPMMRRGVAQSREDLLATLWGSRNPTDRWLGDQAFDYHFHSPSSAPRLLEEGAWRRRGDPGLLLLHPILDLRTGQEMIAFGLSLPHGGPDHVAALRVREAPKP